MWESIAKHLKLFRLKKTILNHPKNGKGTFTFNDASVRMVTFLEVQQSLLSLLPVSSPLRTIASTYWENSISLNLMPSSLKYFY